MSSNGKMESGTVETSDGVKLHTRIFKPIEEIKDNLVIVLVHPYSVLGGCQGLLKGIASGLASKGYRAVTFDMRGVGRSTGRASLTGFQEIKDVVAVCKWVCENLSADRILLVGSSADLYRMFQNRGLRIILGLDDKRGIGSGLGIIAFEATASYEAVLCNLKPQELCSKRRGTGAPISGSAVDQVEQVVGYVSLGYPFGMMASILFGRHHKAILKSSKPKLFVMGTSDGFTSVKQLKNKLSSAAGRVETHLIEGVSHFQMEGPAYDAQMASLISEFIVSL